jgi:hypothetical protein
VFLLLAISIRRIASAYSGAFISALGPAFPAFVHNSRARPPKQFELGTDGNRQPAVQGNLDAHRSLRLRNHGELDSRDFAGIRQRTT